jgi:16S rRNA C967 or C1407 C5-methylase (RsmB/RsmF family)
LPSLPPDAFDELGAMRVAPHRHGLDGFYAARFRRLTRVESVLP